MYYNVAQLLKEPIGSTRSRSLNGSVPFPDGATNNSPVDQLSLMRTDRGIWVSARLAVRLWVNCSRCLKRFRYPVRIDIEEEYVPTFDIKTGQPLRVAERVDGSFTIDQRHVLDLGEAVRQYTLTDQSMNPLCSQDCRGLCPICGVDRNANSCSCQEGAIDPQWAPLLDLRGKDSH